MTDYSKLAVYTINDFLWSKLKEVGILDEQDYYADGFDTPLKPIIPAQQVPEFNNLLPGKTYIIYDYEIMVTPENYWMTNEKVTYSIVSPNYDKINQIITYIQSLLSRFDDAATDLNRFNNDQTPFIFHYLYNDDTFSPQPFASEGGLMLGEVTLAYEYVRKD